MSAARKIKLSENEVALLLWTFQRGIDCFIREYEWPSIGGLGKPDVLKLVSSLTSHGLVDRGSSCPRTAARRWKITSAGKTEAAGRIPASERIYYPRHP